MSRLPVLARFRLPDGREFDCESDCAPENADSQEFWWTEGNGGCDCNRSLALNNRHDLKLGEYDEETDRWMMPCGETLTLVSLAVDGAVLPGVTEVTQ
jgi:hypothetical protein